MLKVLVLKVLVLKVLVLTGLVLTGLVVLEVRSAAPLAPSAPFAQHL